MYKLLAVDDEQDTLDTLCHSFPWESVGFTVVKQLSNGLEALHYLQEHPVDALLCDIRMPVMSGLELCKEISERKIDVKIVLLSAYRDFEYARQALQYGISHYMVKPAKYQELVNVFSELKQKLDEKHSPHVHELPPEERMPGLENPVIGSIIDFVQNHYSTVTLQQISEEVNMNASYISVLFKKKTGMNFSDYVLKVRMERAAELLKHSHFKAYEVSEKVGYLNPKNFIRSFKQYYGKTPGQYKHEH